MEQQGGREVIKGVSHRIIVVKSPNRLFEEAIFIIRDDVFSDKGADSAAVIKEARRAASILASAAAVTITAFPPPMIPRSTT